MTDYRNAVAIVGLAGRFPGAADIEQYWTLLSQGRRGLTRFAAEELIAAGATPAELADPDYVPVRGVLPGVEEFDAELFGMTAREAELTDPQQRLLLESARTALEDAGYRPKGCAERVGVFVGAGPSSYRVNNLAGLAREVGELALSLGNDPAFLATRISYLLDLRGPAVTVQTACSTSLVAVHLACQSVLSGESELAVAGGASVTVPQASGYWHTRNGITSADGRCRSFDAAAGGTVAGNGAGVVVLKHAEAAIADRDTIYALIAGSAVNNDGAAKLGFTAPSIAGQAEVIALAHEVSGVSPDDIGYVEAHATATELGDPIEVAALTEAFRRGSRRTGYCALGAVKPNVGHLDAAAGIAGLLKAVLALHREQLPPTIDFDTPNPKIDFAGSPFFVNTESRPWPRVDGAPRYCGVSSFGFGGTNAHAILAEAPPIPSSTSDERPVLLPLSAATPQALAALIESTSAALADVAPADAAHTLRHGRTVFAHRAAIATDRRDGLAEPLLASRRTAGPIGNVVFLFPGQGTLRPGMLRELYHRYPVVGDTVDDCAKELTAELGIDLREVLCGDADLPAVRQPALFVAGLSLSALAVHLGLAPTAVFGHSLGEYVAATVAGALPVGDALTLVARRGLAMAQLPPGAMLVVAGQPAKLAPLLPTGVWIAGINGPDSVTVAGHPEPIDRLRDRLRAERVATTRLDVDIAFHTPLVEPALPELSEVAAQPLGIPLIGGETGALIPAGARLDGDHWVAHARRPVRLDAAMATVLALPDALYLELGAGRGLTAALGRAATGQRPAAFAVGGRDPVLREVDVLGALAGCWTAGGPLDFAALPGQRGRRIPLPTYPYQRRRHWIDAPGAATEVAEPEPAAPAAQPVDETVARISRIWTELLGADAARPSVNFLELGGTSLTAIQLLTRLRRDFGVRLPLRAVFDNPSIEGIAELVRAKVGRP